jgi:hypothetical protein
MKDNSLNIIRRIGSAVKFFGLGTIFGVYISHVQFRYSYLLIFILIFVGECTRVWATHQLAKK